MSSVLARSLLVDDPVAVEIHDRAVVVRVPWFLSEREAATTEAGAAALLLLQSGDVEVVAEPHGEPRPLASTLQAVTAALREARA
jgi:hypothetical protein